MPIALTPGEEREVVLPCDSKLPEDQRTYFKVRSLTQRERTSIRDRAVSMDQDTGEVTTKNGTQALLAVQCGLVGWRNFRDASGNEVECVLEEKARTIAGVKRRPPTDASLDRLRTSDLQALAKLIMEDNSLDADDTKD